jgi:hypothetical protein
MADALLIASLSGGELMARAQKEYMKRCPRPYMKILSAVMEEDLSGESFCLSAALMFVTPLGADRLERHLGTLFCARASTCCMAVAGTSGDPL